MKRDREASRRAILVRLDASGSMEPYAEGMVRAYNAWLQGVAAVSQADDAYVDVATFNTRVDPVYRGPLAGALAPEQPLTVARYVCEGGTALHDAVGGAVAWIAGEEGNTYDDVTLLVASDGLNNVASAVGHDALSIDLALRALRRSERQRVRVVFLCAGSEAQYAAECMGVSATGEHGDVMIAVQAPAELPASLSSQYVIAACSQQQPPDDDDDDICSLRTKDDHVQQEPLFATQLSASL